MSSPFLRRRAAGADGQPNRLHPIWQGVGAALVAGLFGVLMWKLNGTSEVRSEAAQAVDYSQYDTPHPAELGFACTAETKAEDCPDRGFGKHCYPGPNSAMSYCIDRSASCAFPGTDGVVAGAEKEFLGHLYRCMTTGLAEGEAAHWLVFK